MKRKVDNRIIIVRRNTRLDDLIARFNTVSQAKFYVEHLGSSFDDYEQEHKEYYNSLKIVKMQLSALTKIHILDRTFLPNFIFARDDVIVVVGQDGLVANTLKYLNGQLTFGVNPDKKRWDGVLLPFGAQDVAEAVEDAVKGRRSIKDVTMGKLSLQNGQELLAVNDFFIGQKTHISARYLIRYNGQEENQSSSGIIVSTGLGASGWIRSVLTGANGIMNAISNKKQKIQSKTGNLWGADYLTFSVREPFPSKTTGTSIIFGKIPAGESLSIVSNMGENGVIFSDGIEKDYLEFNSGMEARITISDIKGKIVV
jgi:NAD kinase